MRRHNVNAVLRHVHVRGAISRADLTGLVGLNRSTIKAIVAELTERGLVSEELPKTRVGAGRPSHVVVPRPHAAYVLAAAMSIDCVQVAAVGLGGRVLARREAPLGSGAQSEPAAVVALLARALRRLRRELPSDAWLVGVGVSMPGLVRRTDGYVELAPNLGWVGVSFGLRLQARLALGVPIRIGNDADAGALAEHIRGAGRGVDNLIYICGEVGVGGGLVIDGRIVTGSGGYAGELGHLGVNPTGRTCRCGSVGCLETEVGVAALLRAGGRPIDGGPAAARELVEHALNGEAEATQAVEHVAGWLGRGLGGIVNLLNPDIVILGGTLTSVFLAAQDVVRHALGASTLAASGRQLRITTPGLGADSSLLGAAELAFQPLLYDEGDGSNRSSG